MHTTFPGDVTPLPVDELVTVVFHWSTKHGPCYDCGLPAAFLAPKAYGEDGAGQKLCAVCAANGAADGEQIERLNKD